MEWEFAALYVLNLIVISSSYWYWIWYSPPFMSELAYEFKWWNWRWCFGIEIGELHKYKLMFSLMSRHSIPVYPGLVIFSIVFHVSEYCQIISFLLVSLLLLVNNMGILSAFYKQLQLWLLFSIFLYLRIILFQEYQGCRDLWVVASDFTIWSQVRC